MKYTPYPINVPNTLTAIRILLTPLFVIFLLRHMIFAALLTFVLAAISDGLDGFIAKHYDMASELGAILDPLADKALILSSYLMLMLLGDLPFWLFLTVIFRDVLILVGSLLYVALNGRMKMKPSYLSKLNTFTQLALIVSILAERTFPVDYPVLIEYLVYATAITTILSGLHYAWVWLVKEEVELVDGNRNEDEQDH